MSLTRVTRKGQITIPKPVRDALGISQSDIVVVVVDGDKAILRRVQRGKASELRGRLPATRPYPGTEAMRRGANLRETGARAVAGGVLDADLTPGSSPPRRGQG